MLYFYSFVQFISVLFLARTGTASVGVVHFSCWMNPVVRLLFAGGGGGQ
jgi:hypothetical protein